MPTTKIVTVVQYYTIILNSKISKITPILKIHFFKQISIF